ncbi:MAG: class I SAM-dependent methyltransferase [Actinomycetota bacterium]|nr:class I SAM-dependent methyltransferase [Actinomycetota bacterium]
MPGRAAAAVRHHLGLLRHRWIPPASAKADHELAFWTERWEPQLRAGQLTGPDTLELSGDELVADTYEGRRRQQARAEVRRVLREAELPDDFFDGKTVLDIGSGALGFPDACPAAVSISVEPLTHRYAAAGLLLDSDAVYLAVGAEDIPLRSQSVDVVVSRNNLDHVDDPQAVLSEVKRLLRPGGAFVLNVDVDHTPTPSEPHRLPVAELRHWLAPLRIASERHWDHPHGADGHAVVIVAHAPEGSR